MKKKSADLFKVITKTGGPEHPLKSLARNTEENTSENDLIEETSDKPVSVPISNRSTIQVQREPELHETVRQTFLITKEKLEALKNIVYFKKVNGSIYTTQQDVLEEAIDTLLEKLGNIPERPEEEKQREKLKKRGRKRKS